MRLLAALVLAAAVVTLAAWLVVDAPGPGPSGDVEVFIVGPDGPMVETVVHVDEPTALSALRAAATAAGLEVELEDYAGFGACGAYVERIGAHRGGQAGSGGGWTFQVAGPAGTGGRVWEHPLRSADCVPVPAGGAVRWQWTDSGVY